MKGFILAGGKGTRLRPVTYEIPKPLIPVQGKAVLTHIVELFLKYKIKDIKINVQKKDELKFKKWRKENFPDKNISFLVESKPSGTLGPLKKSESWFDGSLLVSNGDELKDIDLNRMIKWHKEKESISTIALVKSKNPSSYGVAILEKNKIIDFLEKPKNPPTPYINSGLYIFEPNIKKYFPTKEFSMLEKDLFPELAKKRKLFGYKWHGKWQDTGTFSRWEKAIKNW